MIDYWLGVGNEEDEEFLDLSRLILYKAKIHVFYNLWSKFWSTLVLECNLRINISIGTLDVFKGREMADGKRYLIKGNLE